MFSVQCSANPISQTIPYQIFAEQIFLFVSTLLINIQPGFQAHKKETNRSYCFNYHIVSRSFVHIIQINNNHNNKSNGIKAHSIFLKKFFVSIRRCVGRVFQNNRFVSYAFYLVFFFFSDFAQYLFYFIRTDTVLWHDYNDQKPPNTLADSPHLWNHIFFLFVHFESPSFFIFFFQFFFISKRNLFRLSIDKINNYRWSESVHEFNQKNESAKRKMVSNAVNMKGPSVSTFMLFFISVRLSNRFI